MPSTTQSAQATDIRAPDIGKAASALWFIMGSVLVFWIICFMIYWWRTRKRRQSVNTGTAGLGVKRLFSRKRFQKPELCGEGVRTEEHRSPAELEGQRISRLFLVHGVWRAELESPKAEVEDTRRMPAELAAGTPRSGDRTDQDQQPAQATPTFELPQK
ncbi:hypothetical protein Slin15195_G002720 [Septoria linicola]|uniref:Uncharacterized protein n=1 Tax=Septoria linicola TaxID=215465 RepID=A0A9Q9EF89_9PEZI|nr:hypothetical protein Slin15195_G002720 [Septoria linicola]